MNFESKFIDKTGYYYRTQSRELLKKLDVKYKNNHNFRFQNTSFKFSRS